MVDKANLNDENNYTVKLTRAVRLTDNGPVIHPKDKQTMSGKVLRELLDKEGDEVIDGDSIKEA